MILQCKLILFVGERLHITYKYRSTAEMVHAQTLNINLEWQKVHIENTIKDFVSQKADFFWKEQQLAKISD